MVEAAPDETTTDEALELAMSSIRYVMKRVSAEQIQLGTPLEESFALYHLGASIRRLEELRERLRAEDLAR